MLTPRVRLFRVELLVEGCGRSLVAAVRLESVFVVSYRPVRRLVLDETAVFQPRERRTDPALIESGLGGNLTGLERAVLVGGEESGDLVRNGEVREDVLARVLESLAIEDIVVCS